MGAEHGRDFTLKKNNTKIAGLTQKSFSWAGTPIDVTADEDAGFRKLLSGGMGSEAIDISAEGVWKDDVLRALALNPAGEKVLTDVTLAFAEGGTLSGNFALTAYQETGTHNDKVTFTCSLQSDGQWTYTAA